MSLKAMLLTIVVVPLLPVLILLFPFVALVSVVYHNIKLELEEREADKEHKRLEAKYGKRRKHV